MTKNEAIEAITVQIVTNNSYCGLECTFSESRYYCGLFDMYLISEFGEPLRCEQCKILKGE